MEFKQTQLPNGLKVIAEVNPSAASLAVGFFVRTGSRDEDDRTAGVSHFLEHMMFKGTERRSAFDINREFDEMGASYNAFTSEENTVYYAAVLPEFQARVLDLLADMLRPALREEDFQTEKKVILEEIALYQDRPQYRLYEKLMARHFAGHPLGRSVLGTRESITALRREDMLAYFDRRYSPSNVTLVGTGRIDWEAFADKAAAACSHWEAFEAPRARPPADAGGGVGVMADGRLGRQYVGIMSRAPCAQDERRYAASLAATVLGDVTGSRLFYALVAPAIAEEADCGYEPLDGEGAFMTLLVTDPGRAGEALEIARKELARFRAEGPTEAELTAAKNKAASAVTRKGELPMGRLTAVGFDWIYRQTYRPLGEHIDRILAVTTDEIVEVVREYDLTSATILALGPNEKLL
ncbi:MAG: hypothetical protein B1H04_05800 [Planctomycetales bacterium 4484_123]|nr:MAG: hypothetical protein B1H04_05800 [Planctomycetales bacterium 4484_123]